MDLLNTWYIVVYPFGTIGRLAINPILDRDAQEVRQATAIHGDIGN